MLQTDVLAEGSSAIADGGEYIRIHLQRELMDRSTAKNTQRYPFGATKLSKYAILLIVLLTPAHNPLFFLIGTLSSSLFVLYFYLRIFLP